MNAVNNNPRVIIVGGGWAGLAAAVELICHDFQVTLLESAKQLGGRARRIPFSSHSSQENGIQENTNSVISVDNGQHLLLGAYDSTLTLIRTVGLKERDAFKRSLLYLSMYSHKATRNKQRLIMKIGNLPAPIHLAKGLLSAKGLSFGEKLAALKFSRQMSKQNFTLAEDISCLSLLKQYNQTDRLIQYIWQPLCLAALNTHIHEASAQVFLRTLRESFTHARKDSHYLFPRLDLGAIFPDPAVDFIERHGGRIKLAARATAINLKNDSVVGVTVDNKLYESPYVILATPFHASQKLIAPHETLGELNKKLLSLDSSPITTVYLKYPHVVSMGREMTGFVDSISQWAIDRSLTGEKGLIGVVVSGSGDHMSMDNTTLSKVITAEMAHFFPKWPEPSDTMVVREKRATFNCTVDINKSRPAHRTVVKGLWLAGDYTDTQLPATIEGAVRSGIRCARDIINSALT